MKRIVKKYRTDESVEVDTVDCPACAALEQYGCSPGIIFFECDGQVYRCEYLGLGAWVCGAVTSKDADAELDAAP